MESYKSIMKVACDVDGVIADTPSMIDKYLAKRGVSAKFESYVPTIEGVEDSVSYMSEMVYEMMKNDLHNIKPYEDAIYNIPNIDKYIGPITFITARNSDFKEDTIKWISDNFENLTFGIAFKKSKVDFLLRENFDFIIEDRLKTANECAESGILTFLINRNWNMRRYTHENVIRVSSISTVFSLVVSKYKKMDY